MFDPKGFFKSRSSLQRELASARTLIRDLDHQVRESLKRKAITPEEEERFIEVHQAYLRLNKEQNEIALFLRANFAQEIASGAHGGMSLSQVVCMYLGRVAAGKERVQ